MFQKTRDNVFDDKLNKKC